MSERCKNYNWAEIVILTMTACIAQVSWVAVIAVGAGSVTSCRELADARPV
jgi:hypothetical protein